MKQVAWLIVGVSLILGWLWFMAQPWATEGVSFFRILVYSDRGFEEVHTGLIVISVGMLTLAAGALIAGGRKQK